MGKVRFAIAAGTMLAFANGASADNDRTAAAARVVEAMGGVSQIEASLIQLRDALTKDMSEREPTKAQEFAAFLEKETASSSPRASAYLASVKQTATAFYAEKFTTEELQAIAAFQSSEAGRKFQALTPQLAAIVGPGMMKFQQQLIQDLQSATDQPAWRGKPTDAPK